MSRNAAEVQELAEGLRSADTETILRKLSERFGDRLVFATSLGAEDQVLLHLVSQFAPATRIITLDTGRLPQETYDLLDKNRDFFGLNIRVVQPDGQAVREMVEAKGANLFYRSIENRKECCRIRKVEPLRKELSGYAAWITGLRRDQSPTRTTVQTIEFDEGFGLVKANPLLDWTRDQVWDYIRAHGLPYNALHDRGYPSIGCLPCTRAVEPGEDERAGRWWWEKPEQKECGLHISPDRAAGRRIDIAQFQGGAGV